MNFCIVELESKVPPVAVIKDPSLILGCTFLTMKLFPLKVLVTTSPVAPPGPPWVMMSPANKYTLD